MIIVFIISVLIASFSQILLKKGSNKKNIYFNKNTIIGYIILVISTLLTALAYKKVDLSMGIILESLSYIFVPILSLYILKEKISKKTLFGMLIIIFGIILYNF